MKQNEDQSLIDIIEIDDRSLALEKIETIARDEKVRRQYEKRYPNSLYSTILPCVC